MLFYTANPALDASNYYDYCEQRQIEWESKCMKCDCCGKPLDPNFDDTKYSYEDGDIHFCKECVAKLLKEVRKINPFFASMTEDALDTFYTDSPIPD